LNEIRRIKQKRSTTVTTNNRSTTKKSSETKQTTTAVNTSIVSSSSSPLRSPSVLSVDTTATAATTKSIAGSSDSSSLSTGVQNGIDANSGSGGSSSTNSLRSSFPYIDSIPFFKDDDDDDATSIGTIEDDSVAPPKLFTLTHAVNCITNNMMHMKNRGIFSTMKSPHHLFPIKATIGIYANSNYSSINSLGSRPYIDSFPFFKDDDDTTSIGTIEDVDSFEEPCLCLSSPSPKTVFG
jgi:hypothetical protein